MFLAQEFETSRTHDKNNVCHSYQSYTFVVDCDQNTEMPSFGGNQPVDISSFTPLSAYNLGIVSCAHLHSEEKTKTTCLSCVLDTLRVAVIY